MQASNAALVAGLIALLAVLLWGALSDLFRYRIPNRVCALAAGLYPLALASGSLMGWFAGLAVGASVLAIGLILFARGWVGGGDVKFCAAIALWAGPALFSGFVLATALTAIGLSLVWLSPLRRLLPQPPGEVSSDYRRPVPFGVPLAVGGAWVALWRLSLIL